ncbi:MAG TPA: amidase [Vicinamibacterales bacterium]|jgi:aspartyl-tRNA(Asn)/glutamyl-tRNA(Gln) amidotransferase subunit A
MMTIADAQARLRSGQTTSVELVDASLQAIERDSARLNAFVRVWPDAARAAAREADAARERRADRGPLHGIPISLKDLIDVAGEVTTAGSRVLADHVAERDAPVVTRLRHAGAIFLGKTNLHEFALGTTSEDSAWGPVRHPRDPSRVAGGSSGGSAVAVALGMGLASIGTDTGGSIRIPAAACGIVGLKPAQGDVPNDGVVPLGRSLDHVGPLAASVQDAAWIWAILSGRDAPTLNPPPPGALRLRQLVGYFASPVSPEVNQTVERALQRLRSAGATVTTAEVPLATSLQEAYVNTVLPEAAFWHERYLDTRGDDYTPLVRSRLSSGRDIPAVKYFAAQDVRIELRREVDAALDGCDALLLPTLPIVAPLIGESEIAIDPSSRTRTPVRSAMLRHTQLFNMTGHPAISLPLDTPGLPVGLQLAGRFQDTAGLLAVAAACERILRG